MTRFGRQFPRISVVTPSLNRGGFIEKAILSVLEQNYARTEYIIIDGGSTDNSVDIIRKYKKHLKYWTSEPDRGQSHAINKGLEHASGDLMAWMNSDDYYMPGAFSAVADLWTSEPNAGAYVGAGQMIEKVSGGVVCYKEPEEISFQSLLSWTGQGLFMQPSCFFARAAWSGCGPLDETMHFAMDVDLWFKIARDFRYSTCKTLLSTSVIHSEAKTMAFHDKTMIDMAIVLMRHGAEKEARNILNRMEKRLSFAEPNLIKIMAHPLVRLAQPVMRLFVKPAVRWREVFETERLDRREA